MLVDYSRVPAPLAFTFPTLTMMFPELPLFSRCIVSVHAEHLTISYPLDFDHIKFSIKFSSQRKASLKRDNSYS